MLYCNIIFESRSADDITSVSAEDNFVIGYLKALDDYFYPYKQYLILKQRRKWMAAILFLLFWHWQERRMLTSAHRGNMLIRFSGTKTLKRFEKGC
jgi:hypothetical protein